MAGAAVRAVAGAVAAVAAVALAASACRQTTVPAPVQPEAVLPRPGAPAAGRGSLVGIVADSATGFPVWGAEVYFTSDSVIGTGRATPRRDVPMDTTGRDGSFALLDLVPGRYTLAFFHLDHHPMRQVVIVRPGLVESLVLRPQRRVIPR